MRLSVFRSRRRSNLTPVTCDAKIRPFPNDTEIRCERDDHADMEHSAILRDYAFPGSETMLSWQEDDRRNFRGDWRKCPAACVLPIHHHGRHAP